MYSPSDDTTKQSAIRYALPFIAFVSFLALWTWELLAENPVPDSIKSLIPIEWRFFLAKTLHVVAYAFLTFLARLLPVPRMIFWIVIAFLILHGIATEFGQTFVSGRHGSIRDVLLDWAGVALGLLADFAFTRVRKGFNRS